MSFPARDVSELFVLIGEDEKPINGLVEAFYAQVALDNALRALYPDDLADAKDHLTWFLIQRFGGPPHFDNRRGAPMLRRRHVQFPITSDMARRWFAAMRAAVENTPDFAPYQDLVLQYFEDAAVFLINRQEPMGIEIAT